MSDDDNLSGEVSAVFDWETGLVEWRIPGNSSAHILHSPEFDGFGSSWRLNILNTRNSVLDLERTNSGSPVTIDYKWGIKEEDGTFKKGPDGRKVFIEKGEFAWGKMEIRRLWKELTPQSTLTVTCRMCLKADTCNLLCNLRTLSENLKHLYRESLVWDVKIKVSDREFFVHKSILATRSPVFAAMFSHDMSESNTDTVSLDDCDTEVFEEFLLFLYSGKVESLSVENVYGLYYAADKYDLPELKEQCAEFMSRILTVETFFDVLRLADKYEDSNLLDAATAFFAKNVQLLLVSSEWKKLLVENLDLANELYLKGYTEKRL